MLNPSKLSPQPLCGSWIRARSEEFHLSLLPNFYSYSFALVMRYMNDSNRLRETQEPHQQDTHQTQQPATIGQHVPLRPAFAVPPPLTQYPATQSGSWNQTIHPLQPIARKSSATATITRRSSSADVVDWVTDTPAPTSGRPASTPSQYASELKSAKFIRYEF